MRALKAFLIAAYISCAMVSYAEAPIMTTEVPQRFILKEGPFSEEECYKFDTSTGQLWEIQNFHNPEKVKVTPFSGIKTETDPYNGRFTFNVLSHNGHVWIYVFDSKTGNVWITNILNRKKDYQFHILPE